MTAHAETPARTAAAAGHIRTFLRALETLSGRSLPVRLPDGTELGPADAPYRLVLEHWWSLRRIWLPPYDLRAGEAYVEGDIDIEGDIEAAMSAAAELSAHLPGARARLRLLRPLLRLPSPPRRSHPRRARLRGRMHSKERDRAAVAFHYDLPDEFYRQFLDRRLVYSCAYFLDPGEPLDAAQERKLDLVCRKLRLRPGQRLLDIGCGWGSLLLHAAERYGVSGLGVTLSATQQQAAGERIAAAGLAGRVGVRLQDYRDLDGQFDAVASIGMFEHVGPQHLAQYYAAAWRLARPGGLFLNHGITLGDPRREMSGKGRTFTSTYVFPDGGLVPAWRAVKELEDAGFELLDVEQLRPSYTLTLRNWVRRLEGNRDAAVRAGSEEDYRVWRAYMAGSAVGFDRGDLGVIQVLGSKGHRVPFGRAWMLAGDDRPAR
ncbi:MAG TPA: cyclopropane-fatty-acyl-phospholipid synthase family protein [Actinomycetes bacterium]|nr:cyclopropane-fatty-acyl-phospholipid synthase family protein [Actinomycetes bacterium]